MIISVVSTSEDQAVTVGGSVEAERWSWMLDTRCFISVIIAETLDARAAER